MSTLLDDDPFANLAQAPRPSNVVVEHVPRPTVARPRSSGHGQARPAHTRPAFAPRPSLPSLHALAQMNVSIPGRKIRKGTPGARLPYEPWDMNLAAEFLLVARNNPVSPPPVAATSATCLASREVASLADETSSSRSLSGDDADMDSLPSLSHSPSEPSSAALSSPASIDVNTPMDTSDSTTHHAPDDDDPLSYHSDFDYYTQSFSDPSDSESDPDITNPHSAATPYTSLYSPDVDSQPTSSPDAMRRVSVQRTQPIASLIANPTQQDNNWPVPERQPGREDDTRGRQASATRGKPRSPVSTPPDYTSSSSSDDDADGGTVYYSLDGMSNPSRAHSRTHSRHSKVGPGSDDDVPLAQRVPTALSAQKSIRKQLHDERQQRRLERARSSRRAADTPVPSQPTEHLPVPPSRFRKRSMSAAPAPGSHARPAPVEPFPVQDLTRKLMSLQACPRIPPATAPLTYEPLSVSPWGPSYSKTLSRSSSRGKHAEYAHLQQKSSRVPEPPPQDRQLRAMRSFHRPDGRHSEIQPVDHAATRLGRSTTAIVATHTTRAGRDAPEQYPKSSRVSEEGRRPSATIPRSSADRENDAPQRQRPPVPPLPISDSTPPQLTVSRGPVVQQRIFIGDMQRFNMVEIAPSTNAGDVIDAVARQGMLDRSGSWMIFELAQDYGMERPIRSYELLSDVSASWNKDKLLNAFVIKQTPLAPLLSRSALPTSSPTFHGWVEWESKRGKWSKRWMELREHGVWLSKRDTGKDEIFLCSLSNFDAYFVTRRHKAPKGFVFAIKSTDHLSMFEDVADYLHVFCCNPKDGDKWMQVILVARSYVLYQERNVLFAKTGESLSQAKPLARSRTRKQSVSSRPAQPLVHVPPPFGQGPTANIAFEPGSLLAKRKEIAQL